MAAAVVTATTVMKGDANPAMHLVSGTNRRIQTLYLEGAKATQNDWFLLTSYLSSDEIANIIDFNGTVKDSGNAMVDEDFTYDDDDYKLDLASATVGTAFVFIRYYTE